MKKKGIYGQRRSVSIDQRIFSKFVLEKFPIENNSLSKAMKSLLEYAKALGLRWMKYHHITKGLCQLMGV